jgi:hypothetical protein
MFTHYPARSISQNSPLLFLKGNTQVVSAVKAFLSRFLDKPSYLEPISQSLQKTIEGVYLHQRIADFHAL